MSKEFPDIDHSIFHRTNPPPINKALRLRRNAMDTSILLAAGFTQLQKKPRLDQPHQQATGIELHDLCWSCFETSRHKGIRISQVSDVNWPGWSMYGNYVPGTGLDHEIGFVF